MEAMTLREFLISETYADTVTSQSSLMSILSTVAINRANADWHNLTYLLADRLRPYNGVNREQRIYIMKVLAQKYSDRPGYCEEWKP